MRISYKWLKDFLNFEVNPEKLSEDLSLFGFETKEINSYEDDFIFDLEITPNRGDCLSHLGIAREIAAMYNLKFKLPYYNLEIPDENLSKDVKVTISDKEICPRFTARIIDNLKITESPEWLKNRLIAYGFRPINNIVDVTNYVMIAMGQPLHAFDYNKIYNGQMNISKSSGKEELETLDGKKRSLPQDSIIISDDEKIYDLAGIMGGLSSEVSDWTRTIILEGAIFDPILIRKTSKNISLTTDASYRYERGVDLEATQDGINYATYLLKQSCPDVKIGKLIDIRKDIKKQNKIPLPIGKVNKLLGTNFNEKQSIDYIKRNNFQIVGVSKAENQISVGIPSYRDFDVKIWQDLAEEIARIYGYNEITKKSIEQESSKQKDLDWLKRENIKDVINNIGFTEIYSYSFIAEDKISQSQGDSKNIIEISNPLSDETRFLRTSVLPSLLLQIAKNPWSPDVNVFEIGRVYSKEKHEKWQIACVVSGKSNELLKRIVTDLKINPDIKIVEDKILDNYKIRRKLIYFEADIDNINLSLKKLDTILKNLKYHPISKFSPTVRDLAFIVENSVSSSKLKSTIQNVSENIFLVELFDEFDLAENKYGKNKKNLAYHIWLQDIEEPLNEKNVIDIVNEIIKIIKTKYKGELRQGE